MSLPKREWPVKQLRRARFPCYYEWLEHGMRFAMVIHGTHKSLVEEYRRVTGKESGKMYGFNIGPTDKDGKKYAAVVHFHYRNLMPYIVVHECVHAALCACRQRYRRFDARRKHHEEYLCLWVHRLCRHSFQVLHDAGYWKGKR